MYGVCPRKFALDLSLVPLYSLAPANPPPLHQDNFAKFRKERARVKKLEKQSKLHATATPKTQEQKDALRAKFVETCKKYMGVPYHPSYHKDKESPFHNAPLYLDCCGLTRRALHDLSDEFGFVVGPGNQAYQFETLPIEVPESELKPGDIIFTEGTYHGDKKQQKHNLVHVEVFVGGGESGLQTIGARRQKGNIEILPSYKFTSKNYDITKYYCRSLDTWLEGKCEPLIDPEHWKQKFATHTGTLDTDGKSIFDDCDDCEADGQGDGGDPDLPDGKYFYVNKSNGWKMVSDSLEKRGFTRLPFEYMNRLNFDVKWVENKKNINYPHHKAGQLVNHIENSQIIVNKIGLLTTLQEHYGANFPPKYFPMTYRLDRASEVIGLLEKLEGEDKDSIFIHKPSNQNCGKGIEVVTGAAVKSMLEKPTEDDAALSENSPAAAFNPNSPTRAKKGSTAQGVINSRYSSFNLQPSLVQSYITNPLLVNNKKFDVRVYCLVARMEPAPIVLFHPGYVRLSLEDFTMDNAKLDDLFVHLTNAAVQKKHPNYKTERSIWSMTELGEHLEQVKKVESGEKCVENLNEQFMEIVLDVYKGASKKFIRKFGFFDLFGFDFMVDDNMQAQLLEVNTNPALFCDTEVQSEVIPKCVDATIGYVLKTHEVLGRVDAGKMSQCATGKDVFEAGDDGKPWADFKLLVDEASGFEWAGASKAGEAMVSPRGTGVNAVRELKEAEEAAV